MVVAASHLTTTPWVYTLHTGQGDKSADLYYALQYKVWVSDNIEPGSL